MSFGTHRIEDPSDLYAQGADQPKGSRKEYKLYFGLTPSELDEMVHELQSMRVGLQVDVVFNFFGAVVVCTQLED